SSLAVDHFGVLAMRCSAGTASWAPHSPTGMAGAAGGGGAVAAAGAASAGSVAGAGAGASDEEQATSTKQATNSAVRRDMGNSGNGMDAIQTRTIADARGQRQTPQAPAGSGFRPGTRCMT